MPAINCIDIPTNITPVVVRRNLFIQIKSYISIYIYFLSFFWDIPRNSIRCVVYLKLSLKLLEDCYYPRSEEYCKELKKSDIKIF